MSTFLPLALIERLAPLAHHMGVKVETPFVRAYRKAGGDSDALTRSTRREANKRTQKMVAQGPALWVDGAPVGTKQMPSKEHLQSVMWGQSSDAAALKAWAEDLDFEPISPQVLSALATLATFRSPEALIPLQHAAIKMLSHTTPGGLVPPSPVSFDPTPMQAFWGPSVQKMFRPRKLKSAEEDEQFILGVQLEPTDGGDGHPVQADADGDIYSAEEVLKAAHWWAEYGKWNGIMHGLEQFDGEFIAPEDDRVVVLQSWVTPVPIPSGTYGERQERTVKAGTWLQAFRINDPDIWAEVKSGHYDGLSVGIIHDEIILREEDDES